jgi:1,4-dihydroxy-6-naphthoate synthase
MNNKIRFGFSSCPNDTYIFYALVNGKIDTYGLNFEFIIEDVEDLNKKALNGDIDVTKISFNAYGKVASNFVLSNYGSALGKNNGPLIIAKDRIKEEELPEKVVAIPGINTTANLLMSIALPEVKNKREYLFSDIEDAILSGEVDAGLIIHETRFTYHKKGLNKILDLGEWWESKYNLPLPLGGICISRKFDKPVQLLLDKLIGDSVEYAFEHPQETMDFIKSYAQEISDRVILSHINLYVNEFTKNIGHLGKKSVEFLLQAGKERGFFSDIPRDIFL